MTSTHKTLRQHISQVWISVVCKSVFGPIASTKRDSESLRGEPQHVGEGVAFTALNRVGFTDNLFLEDICPWLTSQYEYDK